MQQSMRCLSRTLHHMFPCIVPDQVNVVPDALSYVVCDSFAGRAFHRPTVQCRLPDPVELSLSLQQVRLLQDQGLSACHWQALSLFCV